MAIVKEVCECPDKQTNWKMEVYGNEYGCCKHCGKKMRKFLGRGDEKNGQGNERTN